MSLATFSLNIKLFCSSNSYLKYQRPPQVQSCPNTHPPANGSSAMEWRLTGPPNEAKLFVEALSTPGFYQILNGQLLSYDAYVKHIEEMRAKVGDYKPVL